MKNIILAVVAMTFMVGCTPSATAEESTTTTDQLLDAIAIVESNNNQNARGDFRRGVPMAIGMYQLWTIYVDDVNRIYKTAFTYEDRYDPAKSREMVRKYLTYYGKRYSRLTGKPCTLEVLARIHNGGPNGYRKETTKSYWQKVKKELDKIK